MDELARSIFEKVFSQAGLAGALLLFATVYMARELAKERTAHDVTRGKLADLSEKSILSSITTSEALASIRTTVELLANGRLRR